MTPVFADAYYWFALINPRDQAHQEAQTLSRSLSEPLVTTTWVLTEVGLTDALTGDRDFAQAGFRMLMAPAKG